VGALDRAGLQWLATHAPPQPQFRTLRVGPVASEALAAHMSTLQGTAMADPSTLLAAFDRALDYATVLVHQASQVLLLLPHPHEGVVRVFFCV
jgi:hypothetical protein